MLTEPQPPRIARAVLRAAARLVPADRRSEWGEEWEAELEALVELRRKGRQAAYPGPLRFALGAVPHALWMRKGEGWTMDGILHDLKFAGRVLRRAPGFTVVAALTLALGIGANAAIFSLVNGILFRSPPGISRPDRLVQIARSYDSAPRWDNWSWPALQLIRKEARTLSGVAGYASHPFVVGAGVDAEQVDGELVSGDYFDVLGVRPHIGRLIRPADDVTPGAHAVVVLSYPLWQQRYGRDPGMVGRTIPVGSVPYEVIGVAPPGFAGSETVGAPPQIWVPAMQSPGYGGQLPFDEWGWSWINAVGRLRDDVTFQEARSSMDLVTSRLRDAAPVNKDIRVLVSAGVGLNPRDRLQARAVSLLLLGIVGLVLLITCTNVANLFLTRAAGRTGEIGVRMALGAGRARLIRQLLAESLVLAFFATLLAVPIVLGARHLLPLLLPYALSVPVTVDGRVYAFLASVGLVAGVLFGIAPAWTSSGKGVAEALRETRSSGGRGRTRLRDALVVTQLALCLGLVAGAAVLGRSVLAARSADPGFAPRNLVAGVVNPGSTGRYDPTTGRNLYRRLLSAARALPGVRSVTLASSMPIADGHSRATVTPADDPDNPGYEAEFTVVGPDYFQTMGIPIVEGRTLRGFDDEPERVVVVNQALARLFWPGQDPVGKELAGDPGWRVVGVAGDVQMRSLRAAGRPGVYYPISQAYPGIAALHLRTSGGTGGVARSVREAVASVDPGLPVAQVVDLQQAMTASMGETRTIGYLLGVFAGLALALAAVGLYGLVSFGVSQRVREMGIRTALGAQPEALVRLVLARGLALAVVGLVAGLGLFFLLGRALKGLLFAVGPTDPGSLVVASTILLATAVFAAWLPARRVARVDAAVSLREE